ncbi:MAG TPA: TIGR03936 family radical SAM-associated protein [Planctomycetota bacterium]|nr:TIGR03936 family radical SAM-associated protein [Planctomycetota bacterium]
MSSSRILFRLAKKGEARYLSHRDLMRLFERALRRAGLPVRMTQGFNPHPKLGILAALPVGVEAEAEALEVEFEPPIAASEARERLAAQLPGGLLLNSAATLPDGVRPRVETVVYEAELPEGCGLTPADVDRFLARDAVVVQRGSGPERTELDLRPALRAMSLEGGRLRFELAVADRGTPRASEVLAELLGGGSEALARTRVRRTQVNLALAQSRPQSGTAGTKLQEGDEHAA